MPRFSNKIFKKRKSCNTREVISESSSNDVSEPGLGLASEEQKSSASERKLSSSDYSVYKDSVSEYGKDIIDLGLLSSAILSNTLCKKCTIGSMDVQKIGRQIGLASKLALVCNYSKYEAYFLTSDKCNVDVDGKTETAFEVNLRLAYGLRSIGKGPASARLLRGIMNLPRPAMNSSKYNKMLKGAVKEVAEGTMQVAVSEAVLENTADSETENRDISGAFNGTWQRRGHQSLNGVVTCTSVDTGKVLDAVVFTKFCLCVDKSNHAPNCKANYSGSSGGMEVAGVQALFAQSVPKYNIRYLNYLGDGDSAAFKSVIDSDPYNGVEINKLECIGHIQKRMGSRLRTIKKTRKGKVLADGKTIGGRNRLTYAAIDTLQSYYGQAIRKNNTSVVDMKKGIWATYYHKLSQPTKILSMAYVPPAKNRGASTIRH